VSRREVCKCGHDIDTHHERGYSCLAARCDCPRFRDVNEPDVEDEKAPITEPYPPSWHFVCSEVRVQLGAIQTFHVVGKIVT
jgi:hypothetical protein